MLPWSRSLVLLLLVLVAAPPALADRGERALGVEMAGGYPPGGRLTLQLEEGLSDWLAARLAAGAHLSEIRGDPGPEALASFGLVFALDIFSWVPELFIGAGGAFGEYAIRGRLIARGGVRKYISMDWSLSFGVTGEWSPVDDWLVLGSFGIWWHFDDGT